MWSFDASRYGADVAKLLALAGDGERLMALARPVCVSEDARALLRGRSARFLFGAARHPEAALAGLWLYFGCWEEAHNMAQEIGSVEGSYWHAIVHRQEPDEGNAGYWFRRVGAHPMYPEVLSAASELVGRHPGAGLALGSRWDPYRFVEFCEQAREQPGSALEQCALEIQRAEWQILFDACARPQQ